jgi:signal peptidase I
MKATWPQAITSFLFPILLILIVRWALFEPFVIPSGSMVPNLLIHDHILVNKSSMGLKWPFTDTWMVRWAEPKRSDIIVFKYPENPNVYYIKRLIGLPGDKIDIVGGHITVNGQAWVTNPAAHQADDELGFAYFLENSGNESHRIRFYEGDAGAEDKSHFEVPAESYFFMGDNRDQSSDSRVWGFVPHKNLVGHASYIWLSCENTLASASYICDFSTLRPQRMFHHVH